MMCEASQGDKEIMPLPRPLKEPPCLYIKAGSVKDHCEELSACGDKVSEPHTMMFGEKNSRCRRESTDTNWRIVA